MTYTFDSQLTTHQKHAHLQEWIASSEHVVADAAPGGSNPDEVRHTREEERLHMLRLWQRLVEVEEELADSKADTGDPDSRGDDMQEAWCRLTRLQLRLGGVDLQLRAEQAKAAPSEARIERLRQRMHDLFRRLLVAHERAAQRVRVSLVEELPG